jgi:hypothetical protein
VSAKRKSSKRSATSSTSPPDRPALFIDRDAWSRVLGEALRASGVDFVAHHQRFDHNSPDADWITAVSDNRWIGITRDQNIHRKPNELDAIRRSRAVIFVFTSGNLTAAATADLLLRALPRVFRRAHGTRRPALYSIRQDARIGRLSL